MLSCAVLVAASVVGQPAPTAYEQLKPLEWMVGDWAGVYTSPSDLGDITKGDRVRVCWSIRWMLNKSRFVADSTVDVDGRRISSAREIVGWDPAKKEVSHWIFNTAANGTGTGVWSQLGDKPILRWVTRRDDGELQGTAYVERNGPDSYTWQLKDLRLSDKALPDFPKVTLTRKTGDAPNAIPPKVREELAFMVGSWETEVTIDGKMIGIAYHERDWAPGEHSLTMIWRGTEDGVAVTAIGTSGWNAAAKEVVEHWHDTLGRYTCVRYPLAKMNANAWEGTTTRVYTDGTKGEGTCRLEKGEDSWQYSVDGEQNGKKLTVRTQTRKVAPK